MPFRERLVSWWTNVWFRRIVGGAVAATCLLIGGWLIVDYRASIPPDPANDEADVVIDFFFSDYFDRLSAADRRAYTDALMGRYQGMDEAQRARVSTAVSEQRQSDRDRARERMIELARNFALREAEQYVQLAPDQRAAWLDQRMARWRMMGHDPDRRTGARGDDRPALTEERQARAVQFLQNEVLPRSTAEERALLTTLIGGVLERRRGP